MKQNLTVTFRKISGKRESLRAGVMQLIEKFNIKSAGISEGSFDIHDTEMTEVLNKKSGIEIEVCN